MALKPEFLLLLWGLTLFTHVTSSCNVTCSTDYNVSLNCSCSGSVPTHPVLLQVTCRDEEGEEVEGSCEVKPPQSWCVMYPKELYYIASIGTECRASVRQQDGTVISNESTSWALSDVVKAQPPFSVKVTKTDGVYNITWDSHKEKDFLTYKVRIRESKDLSKDLVFSISSEKKYIELEQDKLQPHVNYTVDVQAKMSGTVYLGPWSEWSSTAEWKTTAASGEIEDNYLNYLWILPGIPLVLFIPLLFCFVRFSQKKLQLLPYIPSPEEFFKPLYHNHGGNFKEWVKPVFNEYDFLRINSHVLIMSEKQHDILQWNNEKQSYSEDPKTKKGGHFLHMLEPHSNLLPHLQDGGTSQGTGHSEGHISIHTVTLSGEEFEGEVMSQSSVNTLRDSFGSFEEDNREHAGYDLDGPHLSGMDRQHAVLPQHQNQISNELSLENINFHPRAHEAERLSLNSFASNEQSEDGYPHVDLDTIDSGFVECSSPGASDSNTGEHQGPDLFHEHNNLNSNYVKQWMICNTIQEVTSNSENEVRVTQ